MPNRSKPEFRDMAPRRNIVVPINPKNDMVPGSKVVVPGTNGTEFSYKSKRDGQSRYVGSLSEYMPTRSPFGPSFRDRLFRSKVVIVDDQRTSRDKAQLDGLSMTKPRPLKKRIPPRPIPKSAQHHDLPKVYQPNRSRTFGA